MHTRSAYKHACMIFMHAMHACTQARVHGLFCWSKRWRGWQRGSSFFLAPLIAVARRAAAGTSERAPDLLPGSSRGDAAALSRVAAAAGLAAVAGLGRRPSYAAAEGLRGTMSSSEHRRGRRAALGVAGELAERTRCRLTSLFGVSRHVERIQLDKTVQALLVISDKSSQQLCMHSMHA